MRLRRIRSTGLIENSETNTSIGEMIKISFTGDLMVLKPQNEISYNKNTGTFDYDRIFDEVSPIFKDSDYVIGNLETPVDTSTKDFTFYDTIFNTPYSFLESIKKCGIDHVTLANNHILDRGVDGLFQTIDSVDKAKLDYSGVYKNNDNADAVFVKEIAGLRMAVLSFTYGTNSKWYNNILPEKDKFIVDLLRSQDEYVGVKYSMKFYALRQMIKRILPQCIREKFSPVFTPACVIGEKQEDEVYKKRFLSKISAARRIADIVVLCVHSGGQYNSEIDAYTENIVKQASVVGCDLIVVNHPHCVLDFKYVNGVPVAYSLGNFCFTPGYGFYHKGVYADYSIVLHVYVDEKKNTISNIAYTMTKTKRNKDGNSVVYPISTLYRKLGLFGRRKLLLDCQNVVRRFLKNTDSEYNVELDEIPIDREDALYKH